MKAAIMDAPGAMRVGEWETPRAGPGEMVVAVEAAGAGVNRSDLEPRRECRGGPADVRANGDGEGAPVVIAATGSTRAMEQTIDLVAPGGRIVIVGLVKHGLAVSLPGLDLTRKEATILGSRASANCFPEALRLLEMGEITYARMATAFGLWEAPRVFERFVAQPGAVHKAILTRETPPSANHGEASC